MSLMLTFSFFFLSGKYIFLVKHHSCGFHVKRSLIFLIIVINIDQLCADLINRDKTPLFWLKLLFSPFQTPKIDLGG